METAITRIKPRTNIRDFLNLAKARSIIPHVITASAAMFLAAGGLPAGFTLLCTLTGGALAAAASNSLNCYFDRELDKQMVRTADRPLPSGRITPGQAMAFSAAAGLSGILILARFVNITAALLTAGALVYYVVVYTALLKRRTWWSAVIGSGVGALTPLVGWAAVTDRLPPAPFVLSAIIILWTLPHYWSLAMYRKKDYAKAGLSVLPSRGAKIWIVLSTMATAAATILLRFTAGLSMFYLVSTYLLGGVFIVLSLTVFREKAAAAYRRLYIYSIIYVCLLFAVMIADKLFF